MFQFNWPPGADFFPLDPETPARLLHGKQNIRASHFTLVGRSLRDCSDFGFDPAPYELEWRHVPALPWGDGLFSPPQTDDLLPPLHTEPDCGDLVPRLYIEVIDYTSSP